MLIIKDSETPQLKHTPTKMGLSRSVIEKEPGLPSQESRVKRILHQEEHIHPDAARALRTRGPRWHPSRQLPTSSCGSVSRPPHLSLSLRALGPVSDRVYHSADARYCAERMMCRGDGGDGDDVTRRQVRRGRPVCLSQVRGNMLPCTLSPGMA